MLTATKPDLESLIKLKLPPLPGSVLKVSSLLQDVNVSQRAIADAIGNDPMLASRILMLANSPIYAFERSITSLNTAVGAIGNRAIYDMIMLGVVADSFTREIKNSATGRDIWLHSLGVAFAARDLCLMLRMRGTDEAFTCGLLHDVGHFLLFRADPTLFTQIFNQGERSNLTSVERAYLGFDHAQLGAAVARKWNLPESICQMILHHHNPFDEGEGLFMTHLIYVADNLVFSKNQGIPVEQEVQFIELVARLGFTVQQLDMVWEKVVANIKEVIKAFFR